MKKKMKKQKKQKKNFMKIVYNNLSQFHYLNDKIINRYPQFGNLTRNIRVRKGEKVDIKISIYNEKNINLNEISEDEQYPGYIKMDAMDFCIGCCSFQVEIGCDFLDDSFKIYDQLIPFPPLFLNLTSNTPIHKGKLCEYDNRWNYIQKC